MNYKKIYEDLDAGKIDFYPDLKVGEISATVTSITFKNSGVVYIDKNGNIEFKTCKESAIEEIKEQPFFWGRYEN